MPWEMINPDNKGGMSALSLALVDNSMVELVEFPISSSGSVNKITNSARLAKNCV